ncbi:hypothetical protein GYB59_02420 [bacterium]|nr:hypothetical protein [bacterium]
MSNRTSNLLLYYIPGLCFLALGIIIYVTSTRDLTQSNAEQVMTDYGRGSGIVSGQILAPDGSVCTTPVDFEFKSAQRNPYGGSSSLGILPGCMGEYKIIAPAGELWLIVAPNDYAMTIIGPIPNWAGGEKTGVDIQLEAGHPLQLYVTDTRGNPIEDADIQGGILLERDCYYRQQPVAQSDGKYVFEHVGDALFQIQVSAAGFETTTRKISDPHARAVRIELPDVFLSSGRVTDAEGNPLSDVKIILRAHYQETFTFPHAEIGRTNEEGEFELDNLVREELYFGYLEAPNGARVTFHDLTADQTGLRFRFPAARTLTGVITGDLTKLNGKENAPVVKIDSELTYKVENTVEHMTRMLYLNEEIPVAINDDVGTFTFHGLLEGQTSLEIGGLKEEFDYDGAGNVHVEVDLDRGLFDIHEAP